MNKTELVEALAARADIPKATAGKSIDALLAIISETMAQGDSVSVVGFGTFKTSERAARTGKNPKTGETLQIPASTVPKFVPGSALKAVVAKPD